MNTNISSVSFRSARFHTRGMAGTEGEDLYDRYQRLVGADQKALMRTHVDLIGAGGLNGEMGHGLVRKGIGRLNIYDFDTVSRSNLQRQFFTAKDIGQNKALALARNLTAQATGQSVLEGNPYPFQEAVRNGPQPTGNLAVVGVDNNDTRIAAAEYYRRRGVPVIFLAVDVTASQGYVMVQEVESNTPCFLCLYPDASLDRRIHGCAGSSIEILKVMAGIALYAVDTLLMARPRSWNYKAVFLNGSGDGARRIVQRSECPICIGL